VADIFPEPDFDPDDFSDRELGFAPPLKGVIIAVTLSIPVWAAIVFTLLKLLG